MTLPFEGAQSLRLAAGQFCWRHDHLTLDWPCATPRNHNSSHGATTSQTSTHRTFATCRVTLPMSAQSGKTRNRCDRGISCGGPPSGEGKGMRRNDTMNQLNQLILYVSRTTPFRSGLDRHLIRAAMVFTFFTFSIQKWSQYT